MDQRKRNMKLGAWLYLIMIVVGVISYYCSEPLIRLMPQDKDGNIAWQYSSFPVLLNIGGLGLAFFGLLYANYEAKEELQRRFLEEK
jgi:Na+-driven multidrug efflux pump